MRRRRARTDGWFGCGNNQAASRFHPSLKWIGVSFEGTFPIQWEITFGIQGQLDFLDGTACQETFFLSSYALDNLEKNGLTRCLSVYTPVSSRASVCVCVCSRLSAVPDSRATSPWPLLTPWDFFTHTFPSTRLCAARVSVDWVRLLLFLLILPSHNNDRGRFPLSFSECKTHFFSAFSQ